LGERITSIIRGTKIGDLGTTLAVTLIAITANIVPSSPILVTLMMKAIHSSDMGSYKSQMAIIP
jgi:hypothetical protein